MNNPIPRLTVVTGAPSRESLPAIVRCALMVPGVLWAIGYLRHLESNCWISVSEAGHVPSVLQGLALPDRNLPATILRALQTGAVEHSRLLSIWLREVTNSELSEDDLDGVASTVAIPLQMEGEGTALLLLGARDRSPALDLLEAFRDDMQGAERNRTQPDPSESDNLSADGSLASFHTLPVSDARLFREMLAMEITRSVRYHRNLSLLTFTILHEDMRDVPEDVIAGVAGVLKSRLRPMDIIGRVRPQTIAAILPETSEGSARWLSPRLRIFANRHLARIDERYAVEIGVASHPRKGDTADTMIDWALRRIIAAPLSVDFRRR